MDQRTIIRRLARLVVIAHGCKGYLPPMGELERELGVCRRTVYRYLAALKDEGVPVRRMNREPAA